MIASTSRNMCRIIWQYTLYNKCSSDGRSASYTSSTLTSLRRILPSAAKVRSRVSSIRKEIPTSTASGMYTCSQHVLCVRVSLSSQHLRRTNVCLSANRGVLFRSFDQSQRRLLYEGTTEHCAIYDRMFGDSY